MNFVLLFKWKFIVGEANCRWYYKNILTGYDLLQPPITTVLILKRAHMNISH